MVNGLAPAFAPPTVHFQARRAALTWLFWFGGVLGVSVLLGLFMLLRGPRVASLVWVIYFIGAAAILFRPRYGLYLVLFFSLAGDAALMPWYPFTKNFSSYESLLFAHNALIINPLESYLFLMLLAWLGRGAMQRKLKLYVSELFWPALVFLAFVIFGLVYGIGTGGNANIALWEARPLFYLVVMSILASNLLEKREHVNHLIWAAMLGLFIESLVGSYHFIVTLRGSLAGVDRITEHAAAMHINTVFILALSAWLYAASPVKRIVLPIMLLPVALTYLAAQRRAAFLTLGIALVLFAVILYREKRRVFWIITPPAALLAGVYLLAFWNSGGALGLPAQAVKSIIAPDQASTADLSSNLYRLIENVNTNFTLHQRPLTGVGFGQKFYVIAPLPDISFFEWWEYLPHNSIIWIWLKMGVAGFIATLFLIGTAVIVGVRVLVQMPRGDMSAIALTAVLYIIMHFTYAYVDISWDTQSMIYVGTMLGLLGTLERIVRQPVVPPRQRWPWQPAPSPVARLRPVRGGQA
jgi:hypothetical protein